MKHGPSRLTPALVAGITTVLVLLAPAPGSLGGAPASARSPVPQPQGRVSGYGFFWQADLAGYGGYQAWAGDLDGDKVSELVVQVVTGEAEGGPPIPPRMAIYDRFAREFEDLSPGAGLAGLFDIDGDGRAEILTTDSLAFRWSADGKHLLADPGLDGPLATWLKENYLPAAAAAGLVADFDGDGTLDLVERGPTTLRLTSKTRGEVTLDFGAGYPKQLAFPKLGRGETSVFAAVLSRAETGKPARLTWWLWRRDPDGTYVRTNGTPAPAARGSEFETDPLAYFADLDRDGVDELVTNDAGRILVYRWAGDAYEKAYESPDNGGLGYSSFATADLDGDGVPELVARHITPTLYHNDLKIYEWHSDRLEGLADIKDIGSWACGTVLAADLLGLGSQQLLIGRDFEACRPTALGLNVDLANLPPPRATAAGKFLGWVRVWRGRVARHPGLAVGAGATAVALAALLATLAVSAASRRRARPRRAPSSRRPAS